MIPLLLLLAQAAAAPNESAPKPSQAELIERYYPAWARDRDIEGRAVIECDVREDRTLANCVVLEETPPGAGFGQATVRLAAHFRMAPGPADLESVAGGRVKIPMNWRLSAPAPEPGQERP